EPTSTGSLSMRPSQSLSSPSHFSSVGAVPPWHTSAPLTHASVPGRHSPTSEPHGWPTPTGMSSGVPLQSLSRPSHTSGLGLIAPTHTGAPMRQVSTPNLHAPTLDWPHGPMSVRPSSMRPLQLSSSPLHISGLD